MGSRDRHHQARPSSWGHSDGLNLGDSVGNRRSFREIKVPADDIGNRHDSSSRQDFIRDDIGNSVDIAPTHSLNSSLVTADGRTRRRKEDMSNSMRVGRYIMGGVNPLVAGTHSYAQAPAGEESREDTTTSSGDALPGDETEFESDGLGGRNKKRRRKRKNDVRVGRDGFATEESAERRLRRLFDFDEDDRFEYFLTSDPEQKRKAAEDTVRTILERAGRLADVKAVLLQNEQRSSVLVVMDEKGVHPSVAVESRVDNADRPLFSRGNIELTALNFIVNKIVNRYPNDRIRLAVLPKADEEEYLKSYHALENEKAESSVQEPAQDAKEE